MWADDATPDVATLRNIIPGRLCFALAQQNSELRADRLLSASRQFDCVWLDLAIDTALLSHVPASKRIVYMHHSGVEHLTEQIEELLAHDALRHILEVEVTSIRDVACVLRTHASRKAPTLQMFCGGKQFAWTRLLAPYLGANTVDTHMGTSLDETGRFDMATLRDVFGLPNMPDSPQLHGIIGPNPYSSQFPLLHNSAYREMDMARLFLPIGCEDLDAFYAAFLNGAEPGPFQWKGFTVVAPFKETCVALSQKVGDGAKASGAANLLVHHDGYWWSDSCDGIALLQLLRRRGLTLPQRVAVIGVGGTGRAAAKALSDRGAMVVLINRNGAHGCKAAWDLELPFQSLNAFNPEPFQLIVQATPSGKAGEQALFALDQCNQDDILMEYVYGSEATELCRCARKKGMQVCDGHAILAEQARLQFHAMTDQHFPESILERYLAHPASPL